MFNWCVVTTGTMKRKLDDTLSVFPPRLTDRQFLEKCITSAIKLTAAVNAAGKVGQNAAGIAAEYAAWEATQYSPSNAPGYTAWGAAGDMVTVEAENAVRAATKDATVQEAKVALHFVLSHDKLDSIIVKSLEPFDLLISDRDTRLLQSITFSNGSIEAMNVGGYCWYLSEVWQLAMGSSSHLSCQGSPFLRLFKERIDAADPTVAKFMWWVMGARYSLHQFELERASSNVLIRDVSKLIYDYLTVPSPPDILQRALQLIDSP